MREMSAAGKLMPVPLLGPKTMSTVRLRSSASRDYFLPAEAHAAPNFGNVGNQCAKEEAPGPLWLVGL